MPDPEPDRTRATRSDDQTKVEEVARLMTRVHELEAHIAYLQTRLRRFMSPEGDNVDY